MLWSEVVGNVKKKRGMKETGSSYDQKFTFSDNLLQNISNKIEKSSKTGQNKEVSRLLLRIF